GCCPSGSPACSFLKIRIDIHLQCGADLLSRKAAVLQKAGLFGAFTGVARQRVAETPAANLGRKRGPIGAGFIDLFLDERLVHALLAQLCTDAHRPLAAAGVMMNEAGRVALVRKHARGAQLVQNRLDLIRIAAPREKLAPELLRGIFAAGEQANGGGFQLLQIAVEAGLVLRVRSGLAPGSPEAPHARLSRQPSPRPPDSWPAAASRGSCPQSPGRSRDAATGIRGRSPCPDRCARRRSCTKSQISPPGPAPRRCR